MLSRGSTRVNSERAVDAARGFAARAGGAPASMARCQRSLPAAPARARALRAVRRRRASATSTLRLVVRLWSETRAKGASRDLHHRDPLIHRTRPGGHGRGRPCAPAPIPCSRFRSLSSPPIPRSTAPNIVADAVMTNSPSAPLVSPHFSPAQLRSAPRPTMGKKCGSRGITTKDALENKQASLLIAQQTIEMEKYGVTSAECVLLSLAAPRPAGGAAAASEIGVSALRSARAALLLIPAARLPPDALTLLISPSPSSLITICLFFFLLSCERSLLASSKIKLDLRVEGDPDVQRIVEDSESYIAPAPRFTQEHAEFICKNRKLATPQAQQHRLTFQAPVLNQWLLDGGVMATYLAAVVASLGKRGLFPVNWYICVYVPKPAGEQTGGVDWHADKNTFPSIARHHLTCCRAIIRVKGGKEEEHEMLLRKASQVGKAKIIWPPHHIIVLPPDVLHADKNLEHAHPEPTAYTISVIADCGKKFIGGVGVTAAAAAPAAAAAAAPAAAAAATVAWKGRGGRQSGAGLPRLQMQKFTFHM